MPTNDELENEAGKPVVLKVRIDDGLHQTLLARSKETGRPQTTEALRLMRKALAQEEALGPRAESGFDLMLAWAGGGSRAVLQKMLENGVPALELQQNVYALTHGSGQPG